MAGMINLLREGIRELRNTREGRKALSCVFAATRYHRVALYRTLRSLLSLAAETGGADLSLGKGKKERDIPISKTTSNAIEEYLRYRKHKTPNSPLFAKTNGKYLDRVLLGRILARLGTDAGVSHVFPHRFRHTFAIQFLRNGGNIYSLQKILGHSTLDMVKRYLAIAQHDLDRDHEIASPVNHWGLR